MAAMFVINVTALVVTSMLAVCFGVRCVLP